jgi:hypothetical protein
MEKLPAQSPAEFTIPKTAGTPNFGPILKLCVKINYGKIPFARPGGQHFGFQGRAGALTKSLLLPFG